MNVFILGLKVTDTAQHSDGKCNVIAEALPSSERRVSTRVQLIQKIDHYVGKLLDQLEEGEEILAIGPTRATPDGILQMQPMLVVTRDNFTDILAVNAFMACGGLGPKAEEVELTDTTVTNRSLAWQDEGKETQWFKLSCWGDLSKQLSELAPGTPTIAVGSVSTSEKDEKNYLNYKVDKILYLPKMSKQAPKKAADPEKGRVAPAAIGSVDFSL
jgi:hypothetical protein